MNKKTAAGKTILTVLTIVWMCVIFLMSSAEQDESDAQSSAVCGLLCGIFVPGYEEMPQDRQEALTDALAFPVRKAAHMTEYAVLGVLLTLTAAAWLRPAETAAAAGNSGDVPVKDSGNALRNALWKDPGKDSGKDPGDIPVKVSGNVPVTGRIGGAVRFSLPLSVLYACSDELHQHFVPGRSGEIRDVLVDSAGVLIGILILAVLSRRRSRRGGELR